MNIYQKLIEVRKIVPYLQKENAGAQYKYVSSSQVLATLKGKMDELGLLLIPAVTGHTLHVSTVETQNDAGVVFKKTSTYFTELDMTMTWVNAEKPDETIVCPWYGQGVDIAGEKGVGKAMTYAEKYFMLKIFNIATDKDDPDAFQDKHSDDKPKKTAAKQTSTKLAESPKTQTNTPQQQETKSTQTTKPAQQGEHFLSTFWRQTRDLGYKQGEVFNFAKQKDVPNLSSCTEEQIKVLYQQLVDLKLHLDKQGA